MPERQLLVAVHDVTPAHADRLWRIYALLDAVGITQYALLVVPNWHGAWPLHAHLEFLADLQARHARGAEVFLHGYRHDEAGLSRTPVQRLAIAGRTAASAEFRLLPPDEIEQRLAAGSAMLEGLGLRTVGFVPPAWLHPRGFLATLRRRGFGITESFWTITRVRDGKTRFAPALSWSTARPWRTVLTAAIAAGRAPVERPRSLVRVAIHPPDIDLPLAARSLERALRGLTRYRRVVSYAACLKAE